MQLKRSLRPIVILSSDCFLLPRQTVPMPWITHIGPAIVPVILPILFWAAYHYHKDRHLPEPPLHLLLAFLLGCVAFGLGLLAYRGLGLLGLRFDAYVLAAENPLGLAFYSVFVIGVIEESVKALPFLLVILRFSDFDEPIDGIIYASFIALGFSAIENFQYLQYLTSKEAMARGFAGPVVHIVFASVWGYYIGRAFLRRRVFWATALSSIAASALLHGAYDYVAIGLPPAALPLAALLVFTIWVWRLRLLRDLHEVASREGNRVT